jgi:hypothetical protein
MFQYRFGGESGGEFSFYFRFSANSVIIDIKPAFS